MSTHKEQSDVKRLKALRQAHNYTQQQLAEMLRTTQQTIARWETGKAEPSVSALRDLAMIFGTSIDDLLGKNPFSTKVVSTALHLSGKKTVADGFWGHVGLLLPGQAHTKWFPVTLGSADDFSRSLANITESVQWICLPTFNNRMLAFSPTKLRRMWLLDDACDAPDDWNDDAKKDYSGNPLEFYRGLDAYFFDRSKLRGTSSETYRRAIEQFVKERHLDEEKAHRLLHYTTIYMTDGASTSYWAQPEQLYEIIFAIDLGDMPAIIPVHAEDGYFYSYYPAANLSLIEMPLIDVVDAAKTAETELAIHEGRDGQACNESEADTGISGDGP